MKFFAKIFLGTAIILLPLSSYAAKITYPKPDGFVTDTAKILTADQETYLETYLANFAEQTSNEIAVLIVNTTEPEVIEEYSIHVTDEWKIGKKGLDNGVLFTVALQDRTMRLEIGRGLEGVLTDTTAKKILDNYAKQKFREGKYYEGIRETIETVAGVAKGEFNIQNLETEKNEDPLGTVITILFYGMPFILSLFASYFSKTKSIHAGGITGSIAGGIIALIGGLPWLWIIMTFFGAGIVGLIFDYIVSNGKGGRGGPGGFWGGFGGRGGGSGGGFGGFGGGSFSGGGGSSRW